MKDKLFELRQNLEKLSVVSDIYDELMSRKITSDAELEEARIKYRFLKKQAMALSLQCKKIIDSVEAKETP